MRQVLQTAGVPPRSGSTILANMGSIRKSSAALKNIVRANTPRRATLLARLPDEL
ncbi:MAG: hypothetical protein ABSF46_23415 [Terriglobia bacterium]|jgi:hypothetical protein